MVLRFPFLLLRAEGFGGDGFGGDSFSGGVLLAEGDTVFRVPIRVKVGPGPLFDSNL